jgi:transposase
MALGKRKDAMQQPLFVVTADLPSLRPNPFYEAVNKVLAGHDFDRYVEGLCAKFYDESNMGRPSLPPGIYVRCLLVGYFEGLDSERGIAWRCSDSRSLGLFLGYAIDELTPDHSTISRTRRLIDLETHQEVFAHVLKILAEQGLIDGKTIGVDGTTLEANAALRSIVRRDTGQGYQDFLAELAKQSGIETPTREDLARLDRKRKNKGSNDDWHNPHDPDAKITKMKDGTTHLAHKAEHAVDMGESGQGAILAVNVCDAVAGDTQTLCDTVNEASENLRAIADDERAGGRISQEWASEVVADKGYHSNGTMRDLREMDLRSYVSEPERGRRNWGDTDSGLDARDATWANRRRIRGPRGRRLMRRRGELIERSFAHTYETGAMRRLHLRRRDNIAKRVLIHAAGFNLGLLMRVRFGLLKPRRLGDAGNSSGGDRGGGNGGGDKDGASESTRAPLSSMWNGIHAPVRPMGQLCRTIEPRLRTLVARLPVQAA